MTTDYDPIAEQYRRCKLHPWRAHVESFTLLELLGPLAGQSVVDLACGEGFYTRLLRHAGAERALGVDLSPGMIELAGQQEAQQRLGIEYRVADCKALGLDEPCDLAVAAYLLNYAPNRSDLDAMCRSIARNLKPGGRFVTVNSNPGLDFRTAPSYRPYGFDVRLEGDLTAGTPITWTFFLADSVFSVENYYLDVPTHEAALLEAGFREVRWHVPRLSPAGQADFGSEYWQPFLAHSPIAFIECLK